MKLFASLLALLIILIPSIPLARAEEAVDETVTIEVQEPTPEEVCKAQLGVKAIPNGAQLYLIRRCLTHYNKELQLKKKLEEVRLSNLKNATKPNTLLERRTIGFKKQLQSHFSRRTLQGLVRKGAVRYRARSRFQKTGTGSSTGTGATK